ncbi:MAG TPA: hypothetical protein VL625_01345 [Patescibacteria group bacterium]|nr:hypothetical protein [Patescibacteria group bacterium]
MSDTADGQHDHDKDTHVHGKEPHKHEGESCEHGDHCCGHCDHDHDDHDHEHPHEHAEGEHVHDEEDHDHEHHDHEHHEHEHAPKEKFTLRGAFHKVVDYIKNNKTESAIMGTTASILLASTALSPPLLPVTLAVALGAASIYAMKKTSDTALDHAMAFGKKLNMHPMKLGLLLGALTTVPEMAASLMALAQGQTQIASGNVLGGNVAHTLLILGATAAIAGISAGKKGLSWAFNTKVMAWATGIFAGAMGLATVLPDKVDQFVLPAAGAGMLYMGYRYLKERLVARDRDNSAAEAAGEKCATGACPFHDHDHDHEHDHGHDHDHEHGHEHHDHEHSDDPLDDGHNHGHSHDGKTGPNPDNMPAWFNGLWTAAGMVGLSGAAALLVHSAQQFGVDVGLSKEFLGAVTVGLGVSVPELYMSINSARRKQSEFALGSVIGCNIFTTLLVGGAVSLAAGLHPDLMKIATPGEALNAAAFVGSAGLATAALTANKGSLKKWHGWASMGMYAAYAAAALMLGHQVPTVQPPQATQTPVIQQQQQLPAPLKAPAMPKVVLNDMPKFVEPGPAAESMALPESYEPPAQETKEAPATFAPAAQQQHLKPAPFALF